MYDDILRICEPRGMPAMEYIRRAIQSAIDREKTAAPAAAENVSRAQYDALAGQVEQLKETVDALELYIQATRKIEPENSGKNNTKKRGQKP